MRHSLLLPLVFLAVSGCIAVESTPPHQTTTTYVTPPRTTTYVTPGPYGTTYVAPGTTSTNTTVVRSPY
jgi:hypothetical protein